MNPPSLLEKWLAGCRTPERQTSRPLRLRRPVRWTNGPEVEGMFSGVLRPTVPQGRCDPGRSTGAGSASLPTRTSTACRGKVFVREPRSLKLAERPSGTRRHPPGGLSPSAGRKAGRTSRRFRPRWGLAHDGLKFRRWRRKQEQASEANNMSGCRLWAESLFAWECTTTENW